MACISKQQLQELQEIFKTDAKIAEKFGVTRQAIHQLRVKYGIKSLTDKNDERNKEMAVLFKKGTPPVDLAKKNDLSVSQVYRILKR
jgi:Mor family transcriptional regulator